MLRGITEFFLWCNNKETSYSVGRAIREIATNEAEANRIWDDPTDEERAAIEKRAWELNDDYLLGEDPLHWGDTEIHRPEQGAKS
jgi:hypothetical protein